MCWLLQRTKKFRLLKSLTSFALVIFPPSPCGWPQGSGGGELLGVCVTCCCRPGEGALQGGPRTLEAGLTWRVHAAIPAHTLLALARGSPAGSSKGQKLT